MKFISKNKKLKKKDLILLSIGATTVIFITVLLILLLKHTHSFSEWEKVRDASCTRYGLERRYCACGEVQEKKHDMIPHNESDWIYNKDKDELIKICTVCEKTLKTNSLENHTHTFGAYSIKSEATCMQNGIAVRSCNCGAIEELPISATGHNFSEWTTKIPAKCEVDGSMERVCSNCQEIETQTINALSHTKGAWIVENNTKKYPCIYCEKTLQSEDIKASEYLHIQNGVVIDIGTCEDKDIVIPSTAHTIGEQSFEYQSITGVILNDSIININNQAFSHCAQLNAIHLGNSLISIEHRAFYKCESLKTVILPDTLITLGEYAFAFCTDIESVTIGENLTKLNCRVFGDCINLRDIYFNGTIEQWNSIEKDIEWDLGTPDYTVHCSDGEISK